MLGKIRFGLLTSRRLGRRGMLPDKYSERMEGLVGGGFVVESGGAGKDDGRDGQVGIHAIFLL